MRILLSFILASLLLFACRKAPDSPRTTPEQSEETTQEEVTPNSPKQPANINEIRFYLENSHSMGGYFRSKTEFYEEIDGIISDLILNDRFQNKVTTYTIADDIVKFPSVSAFREELDPTNSTQIAIAKSSPLDDIIGKIAEASEDNDISILVTDGIISGSNADLQKYDDGNRNKFYNIDFASKLQNNVKVKLNPYASRFAIKLLAYQSNFNSTDKHPYYKLDNNSSSGLQLGEFTERPYYLFLIGKPELIRAFEERTQRVFQPKEYLEIGFDYPDAEIKPTSYFKMMQNCVINGNTIGFEEGKSKYTFGLLVNLNSFDGKYVQPAYLNKNVRIYINGNEHDDLTVETYELPEQKNEIMVANARTTNEIKGFTHLLKIELSNYQPDRDDQMRFKIANALDGWYKDWSSADDRKITLDDDKTFGLSYLVDGIIEAYGADEESYLLDYKLETSVE